MTPADPNASSAPDPNSAPNTAEGRPVGGSGGFLSPQAGERKEARSWMPWMVAALAVVAVLAFVIAASRHRQAAERANATVTTPDAYASKLTIGHVQMSEAANFAGGKVTYIDGQITNGGDRTVVGATVTVTFRNDIGEPPQENTMALSLIRTREPYVDIEPVSADPLKPGDTRDFRLIFDHVSPNWNQQYPSIQVLRTHLK